LQLAPDNVRCLAEAGLLAILRGRSDNGLDLLRRAAKLAPTDAGVVGKLVEGLCQAGQPDEAVRVVRIALFGNSRCPRLRKVWRDLEMSQLRRQQETTRARTGTNDGPVLLPFVRLLGKVTSSPASDQQESMALPVTIPVRQRTRRPRRRVP
jgi:hypothetical protein